MCVEKTSSLSLLLHQSQRHLHSHRVQRRKSRHCGYRYWWWERSGFPGYHWENRERGFTGTTGFTTAVTVIIAVVVIVVVITAGASGVRGLFV